nr:hypothetical protein [uncultured Pseudomonas sp.]
MILRTLNARQAHQAMPLLLLEQRETTSAQIVAIKQRKVGDGLFQNLAFLPWSAINDFDPADSCEY